MADDDNLVELSDIDQLMCIRLGCYLAGPLTALTEEDRPLCREIRAIAKRILSARFHVYDPADYTAPGTEHSSDDVFSEDHTRTSTSDLVFFHIPAPSLGVGIESQIAAEATIPRVVARPKGRKISRMFEGVFNPTVADIEYVDAADFDAQLMNALPVIACAARASADKRRPIIKHVRAGRCGEEIFKARVLLGIPLSQLAAATDIRECMLRRIERDSEVAGTLTLIQLMRLADELKTTIALSGNVPTLQGPSHEPTMPEVQARSLESLYAYLKARKSKWIADDVVFSAWSYAFPDVGQGQVQAARGSDPTAQGQPLSEIAWHQIISDLDTSGDEPMLF